MWCCLTDEQEAYTDLIKRTPKVGAIVKTPLGKGLVVETNLLARTLKVKMDNTPDDAAPQSFKVKEVRVVKNNYINNKGNKKGKEKEPESEELRKLEDK